MNRWSNYLHWIL